MRISRSVHCYGVVVEDVHHVILIRKEKRFAVFQDNQEQYLHVQGSIPDLPRLVRYLPWYLPYLNTVLCVGV
jgi:hypothetical protein